MSKKSNGALRDPIYPVTFIAGSIRLLQMSIQMRFSERHAQNFVWQKGEEEAVTSAHHHLTGNLSKHRWDHEPAGNLFLGSDFLLRQLFILDFEGSQLSWFQKAARDESLTPAAAAESRTPETANVLLLLLLSLCVIRPVSCKRPWDDTTTLHCY